MLARTSILLGSAALGGASPFFLFWAVNIIPCIHHQKPEAVWQQQEF